DSLLALYRDGSGTIVLHVRGRDIEECAKAVKFNDRDTYRWKMLGDVAEIRRSQERAKVIKAMQAIAAPAKPVEIASEAEASVVNVSKLPARRAGEGVVQKLAYGKYSLEGPRGRRES